MGEQIRIEKLRIEQQRIEQQMQEQIRIEKLRIEQQRQEQLRLETLRIEQQRQEQLRLEEQRRQQQLLLQQQSSSSSSSSSDLSSLFGTGHQVKVEVPGTFLEEYNIGKKQTTEPEDPCNITNVFLFSPTGTKIGITKCYHCIFHECYQCHHCS